MGGLCFMMKGGLCCSLSGRGGLLIRVGWTHRSGSFASRMYGQWKWAGER
jgi:hypothetical protein